MIATRLGCEKKKKAALDLKDKSGFLFPGNSVRTLPHLDGSSINSTV